MSFIPSTQTGMPNGFPRWKFNKSVTFHDRQSTNIRHPQAAASVIHQAKRVRIAEEGNKFSGTSVDFPSQQTYPRSCLKTSVTQPYEPAKPTLADLQNWRSIQSCRTIACRKCRSFPLRKLQVPGDIYNPNIHHILDGDDVFEWDWRYMLFYILIAIIWLMVLGSLLGGSTNAPAFAQKAEGHGEFFSRMLARLMEAED